MRLPFSQDSNQVPPLGAGRQEMLNEIGEGARVQQLDRKPRHKQQPFGHLKRMGEQGQFASGTVLLLFEQATDEALAHARMLSQSLLLPVAAVHECAQIGR
jgi:hypothetical protein